MAHVEITINNINTTQIEILIAQLSELSFDGFEELDNCLKAYIKEENYSANLLKVLFDTNNLTYSNSIINEINWNENWESSFHPISVLHFNQESIFAFIRANFHQPNPNATFDLLITPKMSFGTGHHATTFQMIEQMSLIDFANKSVIDFGTGTGLLSILAEKMGANSILAIDNDDWSINNAYENIKSNKCNKINLIKAESCLFDIKADIILANINLNVIIENLKNIKKAAKPKAIIVFSGILVDDESKIIKILYDHEFIISYVSSNNNWLLIKTEL